MHIITYILLGRYLYSMHSVVIDPVQYQKKKKNVGGGVILQSYSLINSQFFINYYDNWKILYLSWYSNLMT